MEHKFEIGDKVKIIKGGAGIQEENEGIGMVGEIINDIEFAQYGVDSKEFKHKLRGDKGLWWFYSDMLELVTDDDQRSSVQSVSNVSSPTMCPRCGGELYEKQMEYCGVVIKCKKCGWC